METAKVGPKAVAKKISNYRWLLAREGEVGGEGLGMVGGEHSL